MKIVRIFDNQLFSFHFENEKFNEIERLLNNWSNTEFLFNYAKVNKVSDQIAFVRSILSQVEKIENMLFLIAQNNYPIRQFFKPLELSENSRTLSLQKGKIKNNQLRLYAIKIDATCFIITGGAIKMSQKMEDHPETSKALKKMIMARNYLKENGVFDEDSFADLLNELI